MQWINISDDNKPNDRQQVWLCFRFNDGVCACGYGIYDKDNDDYFFDVEYGDLIGRIHAYENNCKVAEITHWMPLPDLPKE